jgi:hypothetical protein
MKSSRVLGLKNVLNRSGKKHADPLTSPRTKVFILAYVLTAFGIYICVLSGQSDSHIKIRENARWLIAYSVSKKYRMVVIGIIGKPSFIGRCISLETLLDISNCRRD